MKTITIQCPPIGINFDPFLLCTPIYKFNVENLRQIAEWLQKNILGNKYRKFPNTIGELIIKHQKFIELYEKVKIEEEESKGKPYLKTNWPFFRSRLPNKNDQRIFERLENRIKTSKRRLRKNNKISKV